MSTNPYQSPTSLPELYSSDQVVLRLRALQLVSSPAIALMIVAGISVGVLSLAISEAIFLLATGVADQLPSRGPGHSVPVMFRLAWPFVIFGASCYVFWGGLQMKRLANYGVAWSAAIVACIPCVGPCCLLGIPFGAWALSVLSEADVRRSFKI